MHEYYFHFFDSFSPSVCLVFNFSFFAFSDGLAISFQFEFQKKWKYQIVLFDLSIVSLDIAKIDQASEINLAFAFFK